MYRIIDKRASGKTSRLFLLAKEANGIVVCHNPEDMVKKAYGYGITGIDFVSYKDFLDKNYEINKPIFIDELELLIKHFDNNILGYTLSEE